MGSAFCVLPDPRSCRFALRIQTSLVYNYISWAMCVCVGGKGCWVGEWRVKVLCVGEGGSAGQTGYSVCSVCDLW